VEKTMSNSEAKIVVICPSDIILFGLLEILKSCQAEIFTIHNTDELLDYPNLLGDILVLLPKEVHDKNALFIKKVLSSASDLRFMYISYETGSENSNEYVSLFETQSLVLYKINEALRSFEIEKAQEPTDELTNREKDVLRLVTKGLSNKEIADKLFVSIHTVISHRKNISEKIGIKSASGLTMYAVLKKIVDIGEINTSDLI
jgi:DNA-binding CsgD family transcriptional regulator